MSQPQSYPEEDVKRVERWFSREGVPRFVDRYSFDESVPLATVVLAIVIAFELTARPEGERPWAWWAEDPSWGLWGLASPLILLALLVPALPLLRRFVRAPDTPDEPLRWQQWGWIVAILAVEGVLLSRTTLPPAFASPWVEFAIAACTVVTTLIVVQYEPWRAVSRLSAVVLWGMVAVLAAATALFAIDRTGAEPRTYSFVDSVERDTGIDSLSPHLPALAVALVVLGSVFLIKLWPATDGSKAGPSMLRSLPALILLFGLATAVFPRLPPDETLDAAIMIPLILLALAGPILSEATARVRPGWAVDVWPKIKVSARSKVLLVVTIVMFLLAYPGAVAVDEPGEAWTAASMNSAFFVAAGLVVVFGVDRVIAWGFAEVRRNWLSSLVPLFQGLPLLLIVVIFFGVTAEVWQLANRVTFERFLALPGFLLAVTFLFLVLRSWQETKEHCEFAGWWALRKAALTGNPADNTGIPAVAEWIGKNARPTGKVTVKLHLLQRVNALVVLLTYQAFLLIPVTVVSFFIFLGLGHLAVGEELLRDWQVSPGDGESFENPALFHELWVKPALLLAAFSVLSLSVQATATEQQRDSFFKGTDALRQRLAVRHLYEKAKEKDPTTNSTDSTTSSEIPAPTPSAGVRSRHRLSSPTPGGHDGEQSPGDGSLARPRGRA
jgi:hypothetical protein